MCRPDQIKAMIRETVARFAPELAGYRIFLFGSRATGRAGDRSDFDVGVYGARPLPSPVFSAVEEALDQLPTLYRIDWVDLNRTPASFRQEALKGAELLHG